MRNQFLNINFLKPISLRETPGILGIPLRNGAASKNNWISRKFLPDTLRIRYVMARDSRLGLYGLMKRHLIRNHPRNGAASVIVEGRIPLKKSPLKEPPLKTRRPKVSLKKTLFKERGQDATKLGKLQPSKDKKGNL